ncbi:MAG: hypothetical protein HY080_06835 [Gammaproteobacteria bacterium]|nr:hypothetical protein [Gammaproteobacteria bacterium]
MSDCLPIVFRSYHGTKVSGELYVEIGWSALDYTKRSQKIGVEMTAGGGCALASVQVSKYLQYPR